MIYTYYGGINMDTAKIFKNGRSQAVRLPKSCRFDVQEVYVKKINDLVILVPKDAAWKVLESGVDYFTSDYLKQRSQPAVQERKEI